ncbi:hypothetical protein P153DRAFT_222959 [Dothidotthia symphoricarpi CBS 119687]|uniref:Secreted protein n=1 Tax=Dothidotthia symphoricarpi CBS 119687 TaxID=1392245 RepID=A0A6A6AD32_9PLEO|nr:uncharacterized protein P153DRAFT_222959 [Dothidotthia symphoricarpi CBS 119687]KAF2129729.1 hypothetical protein P153DRAFT_222959 [Dothidotthia symphoricarpi CBS 119687]
MSLVVLSVGLFRAQSSVVCIVFCNTQSIVFRYRCWVLLMHRLQDLAQGCPKKGPGLAKELRPPLARSCLFAVLLAVLNKVSYVHIACSVQPNALVTSDVCAPASGGKFVFCEGGEWV